MANKYNVRDRLSRYEYGAEEDGYAFNPIGAFFLDILRPNDAEVMKILSHPTQFIIVETLYGIFTKMGEIETWDVAEELFQMCENKQWDNVINRLQRIVDEN